MASNLIWSPLLQYIPTGFLLHTYTLMSAAIQFSFVMTTATGEETEALRLGGTQTIFVPVVVNIEPATAILMSDIIIGVTVTGGTAQSKYHK